MRNILVFFFLFASVISYAQTANSNQIVYTNYNMPVTFTATQLLALNTFEGSPYIDKSFKEGIIIDTKKNTTQKAQLRYNYLHDISEILVNNEHKPVILPKLDNIRYTIGDEEFFFGSFKLNGNEELTGYFVELLDKEGFKFIYRYKTIYTPPRIADTPYQEDKPGKLKFKKEYYLQQGDGVLQEIKLKENDLKSFFKDQDVDDYLKKITIKSEEDVLEFLNEYIDARSKS